MSIKVGTLVLIVRACPDYQLEGSIGEVVGGLSRRPAFNSPPVVCYRVKVEGSSAKHPHNRDTWLCTPDQVIPINDPDADVSETDKVDNPVKKQKEFDHAGHAR